MRDFVRSLALLRNDCTVQASTKNPSSSVAHPTVAHPSAFASRRLPRSIHLRRAVICFGSGMHRPAASFGPQMTTSRNMGIVFAGEFFAAALPFNRSVRLDGHAYG